MKKQTIPLHKGLFFIAVWALAIPIVVCPLVDLVAWIYTGNTDLLLGTYERTVMGFLFGLIMMIGSWLMIEIDSA